MKVGDLIRYSDDVNDRLGTHGVVIETDILVCDQETNPSRVSILWNTGEIEQVFEDEVEVISENR
tara:strand:- start:482 stop:676 length:195 start_codon:yes stop_codon:yes gene_type:complete